MEVNMIKDFYGLQMHQPPMKLKDIVTKELVEKKSSYLSFQSSMALMEKTQILEPIPFQNLSLLGKTHLVKSRTTFLMSLIKWSYK